MMKNEDDKKRVGKIMSDIFKDSISITDNTISNSNMFDVNNIWEKVKNGYETLKNSVKYNIIDFKSVVDIRHYGIKINIFSHCYTMNNIKEENAFYNKIASLLFFSYRTNFPALLSNNNCKSNSNSYTSDCGWGCMIRASQMLLSRAIYKILKHKYSFLQEEALYNTILYFLDYPIKASCIPKSFSSIIYKYIKEHNNLITNHTTIQIQPPFSLSTICSVGQLYNKKAGEWFSDFHMPQIFDLINREYNVIDNLAIIPFQSLIDTSVIIQECFKESSHNKYDDNNTIKFDNKHYTFNKAGLIFVSTRLGLDTISPEYYDSIKSIFQCKQCIGFIGGQGVMAYYFFGYNDTHVFYLDPHFNQEANPVITTEFIYTYLPKKLYQLEWGKLQTCLTFGFLFRGINEYNALINWLNIDYQKIQNPCFSTVDSVDYSKYANNDLINFDGDDF